MWWIISASEAKQCDAVSINQKVVVYIWNTLLNKKSITFGLVKPSAKM